MASVPTRRVTLGGRVNFVLSGPAANNIYDSYIKSGKLIDWLINYVITDPQKIYINF